MLRLIYLKYNNLKHKHKQKLEVKQSPSMTANNRQINLQQRTQKLN